MLRCGFFLARNKKQNANAIELGVNPDKIISSIVWCEE